MKITGVKCHLCGEAPMLDSLGFSENTEASAIYGRFMADATNEGCTRTMKGGNRFAGSPRASAMRESEINYEDGCASTSSSRGPSRAYLIRPGVYLDELGAVWPRTMQEECVLTSSTRGLMAHTPKEETKWIINILGERKIV